MPQPLALIKTTTFSLQLGITSLPVPMLVLPSTLIRFLHSKDVQEGWVTNLLCPMLSQCTSEPPLKPNHDFSAWDSDNCYNIIFIFNKLPVGSVNPIFFASVKASYCMIGNERYSPMKSMKLLEGKVFLSLSICNKIGQWVLRSSFLAPRKILSWKCTGSTMLSCPTSGHSE